MTIEKYVEQDFQALETSFSKGESLSDVALPRILENISKLDDADRIYHWHQELRRIGGLPPAVAVSGDAESAKSAAPKGLTGGKGSLSK